MKMKFLPVVVLSLVTSATAFGQWDLTGNNNATGSSKLGTTNIVPLRFFTSNQLRMQIDSAGNVGIGIKPVNIFTVKSSGGIPSASWLNGLNAPIMMGFSDNRSSELVLAAASEVPTARAVFQGRRSRGTLISPAAVANNDYLTSLLASGYDGSSFQNPALINIFVDGTPSAGSVPARISFVTGTNSTDRLERLKIGSTGNFTFNNTQLFLQQSTGALSMGSVAPNASSMLDITSTSKGVLLPRMTKVQRDRIISPAEGLLIYQKNSSPGFYYYRAGWQQLASFSAGANTALSNLQGPTAINVHLLPETSGTVNIGDSVNNWKDIYLDGNVYLGGRKFISAKGNGNSFFGVFSGAELTTGTYNTATGFQSLFSNAIGYSNTADGYQALYTNTGTYNTASGYQSLFYNTTGYANNANGAFALYSNTTGSYNTAYGPDALIGNTTGNSNTAVGLDAIRNINTTSYNTGIGYYAGENTYSTIQGTFLGAQTRGGTGLSNVTAVGYGATATASNQVMLGNSSVMSVKAAGSFVIYSDGRFKKDIKQDVPGLDFINQLRPVTYHYNIHDLDSYIQPSRANDKKGVIDGKESSANITRLTEGNKNEEAILQKERKLYTGFIAQEVEAAANKLNYDFSGLFKPENDKDVYGLSYSDFVVPLVKAVQELSIKTSEMAALKEELAEQKTEIAALKQMLSHLLTSTSSAPPVMNKVILEQNVPNPLSKSTTIRYSIPAGSKNAQLVVKDITGKTVKVIELSALPGGSVSIDATGMATGSYTYSIVIDKVLTQTKKMVVAKEVYSR